MSNYSEDPKMVRVDFWKPSGKWYTTEAIPFIQYDGLIHEAFARSLRSYLGVRLMIMTATCLDPCHKNNHPIMIKDGGWNN